MFCLAALLLCGGYANYCSFMSFEHETKLKTISLPFRPCWQPSSRPPLCLVLAMRNEKYSTYSRPKGAIPTRHYIQRKVSRILPLHSAYIHDVNGSFIPPCPRSEYSWVSRLPCLYRPRRGENCPESGQYTPHLGRYKQGMLETQECLGLGMGEWSLYRIHDAPGYNIVHPSRSPWP